MALSRTTRYSNSVQNTDEVTSSSFTPTNGSFLVAVYGGLCMGANHTESDISVSGGGLTWTKQVYEERLEGGWIAFVSIWTAHVGTGASMTVAAASSEAVDSYQGAYLTVTEYTGHELANPTGAFITGERTGTAGSWTLTLNRPPSANSEIIAGITLDNWATQADFIDTGTGWTAILDSTGPINGELYGHVQVRPAGSTSTDVLWDDAATNGGTFISIAAALEIREATDKHKLSPSWRDETQRIGWPSFPSVNSSGAVANTNPEGVLASLMAPVVVGKPFNTEIFSTYSGIHTVASAPCFSGGVVSPNGELHLVPYNSNLGQKITRTGTVSTYSLIYTTSAAYWGGVLAPNGDIHFIPYSASVGQKISANGAVSTYSLTYTTLAAYNGGVLAPNGDIHFVSFYASVGQKIAPDGTVSTYSLVYTANDTDYAGGVLAPNGDIHFVPCRATVGQKISVAGVVSTYSLIYTTNQGYWGGVIAPNGDIHFVPYSANRGQKIDRNGVVSTYSLIYTNTQAYRCGVLSPNGDIHFIPFAAEHVQKISADGIVSTYPHPTGGLYLAGVYFNNEIHFIRSGNTTPATKLLVPGSKNFNGIHLSPYLNKQ
jgi:hypothetical protein